MSQVDPNSSSTIKHTKPQHVFVFPFCFSFFFFFKYSTPPPSSHPVRAVRVGTWHRDGPCARSLRLFGPSWLCVGHFKAHLRPWRVRYDHRSRLEPRCAGPLNATEVSPGVLPPKKPQMEDTESMILGLRAIVAVSQGPDRSAVSARPSLTAPVAPRGEISSPRCSFSKHPNTWTCTGPDA